MKWMKLKLHFPSFYSYRIPDYSSQYALTLPLIAPSTIKLALVATAIRMSGEVSEGKRIFEYVKDAKVGVKLPKIIVVNSVFIKRLKKKKDQPGFQPSFGVREYVYFSGDVEIYLGLNKIEIPEKLMAYARGIRYLGTSDSIVYVKSAEWIDKEPVGVIYPSEFSKLPEGAIIYPVKDFAKKVTFEQINPYSPNKKAGDSYKTKFYPILLSKRPKKGKNWRLFVIS